MDSKKNLDMPSHPPVSPEEAYMRSIVTLPEVMAEIGQILENLEADMNVLANYVRRKAIDEKIFAPDEFPEIEPTEDEELPV